LDPRANIDLQQSAPLATMPSAEAYSKKLDHKLFKLAALDGTNNET
jgi:hypothetical protein